MHFFTSINLNYLPKARVLAKSVKRNCKDSWFTLVLSDKLPDEFDLSSEPFDEVWLITELGLPVENINLWIFKHTVVELCTAVKGQALLKALNSSRSDKIVYLDPDTVVFDDLSALDDLMDEHDIIITPHITRPLNNKDYIDNIEINSILAHGVYNLGFLAVKKSEEGINFATWWRDRLMEYCIDDVSSGLFTDQKWIDMAPALFNVHILKNTAFNVAAWNVMQRNISSNNDKYYVDGYPLQFYHFTGFDSGAHMMCVNSYAPGNESLFNLLRWYNDEQKQGNENIYAKAVSIYNVYSNNEAVTPSQRYLLRIRKDLHEKFKEQNPYNVTGDDKCYYTWYKNEFTDNNRVEIPHPYDRDKRLKDLEKQVVNFSSGRQLLKAYIRMVIHSKIRNPEKRKNVINFFVRLNKKLKFGK